LSSLRMITYEGSTLDEQLAKVLSDFLKSK
jgi:hypothetical protein